MRTRSRLLTVIAGLLLAAACTPSGESPASVAAPSLSHPAASTVGLPTGCQPVDLRSPSGERIVLDGLWLDDTETPPIYWLLRTQGTCVWGAGQMNRVPFEDTFAMDEVQVMRGMIRQDFTIGGEIILLGQEQSFLRSPIWAEARFLIESNDDELVLREDRERGVPGPRCVDPAQSCLRPLVLIKVVD